MGSGGGGNSGEVNFPDYLEDWHIELLYGGSLPTVGAGEDLHARAFDPTNGIFGAANNPYIGVAAFNPVNNLDTTQDELGELEAMVDSLVIATRVGSLNEVHRDLMKFDLGQAYNRMGAVFASANAVIGTAYPSALAVIETQHQGKSHLIAIQYELEQTRNKVSAVHARIEFMKLRIAALTDQVQQDVHYNVEEVLWDVNAYLRLMSAIGAISGVPAATTQSGRPSTAQSVVGGMASGAAMGTMIMPGWGTAIGAGIGGLLGAFGGGA